MNALTAQLPLDIRLREDASFGRFLPGQNQDVLRTLDALHQAQQNLFLWGQQGAGKTHLLQAACRAAGERQTPCAYLPLDGSLPLEPGMLEGLGRLPLVILDDIHLVLAQPAWEESLFRLFNEAHDENAVVLLAASHAPRGLEVQLPDLATRLSRCVVMEVRPLDGDDSLALFCQRAEERGLEVSDEVSGFLMRRAPRETGALLAVLEQLDTAALAAQRRLTVPFIKQTLGW